jgi:hypothetical protein
VCAVPLSFALTGKWKQTFHATLGVAVGFLPLLLYTMEYTIFPWTLAEWFEKQSYYIPLLEHLLAIGPALPLGLIGFVMCRKKKFVSMLWIWVCISIIIPQIVRALSVSQFSRFVVISNVRFLQMAVWVPLAVGVGWVFEFLVAHLHRAFVFVIVILLLGVTLYGYPTALKVERMRVFGAYEFQFPTYGFLDAIAFVRTVTHPDDVVLALPLAGQIIPSYTDRTVFVGNERFYTNNLGKKMDAAWLFYKGMPVCAAYNLLVQNRIHTVFDGFNEQNTGNAILSYPFLRQAGDFGGTKVFVVSEKPAECR